MYYLYTTLTILVILFVLSCKNNVKTSDRNDKFSTSIVKTSFGKLSDGQEAELYTLTNNNGMTVSITNYGGIIVSVWVPDKNGIMADVVLGYDSVGLYEKKQSLLWGYHREVRKQNSKWQIYIGWQILSISNK